MDIVICLIPTISRTFVQPLGQMFNNERTLSSDGWAERIFAILVKNLKLDEGTATWTNAIQNNGTRMVRNVFQLLETSNYTMLTLDMQGARILKISMYGLNQD